MTKLKDLFDEIRGGAFDDRLGAIITECQARKTLLARVRVKELRAGDTVILTGGLRPKYLRGATATVIRTTPSKVVVDFPKDMDLRRYSGAQSVQVPATCVEKLPVEVHDGPQKA